MDLKARIAVLKVSGFSISEQAMSDLGLAVNAVRRMSQL